MAYAATRDPLDLVSPCVISRVHASTFVFTNGESGCNQEVTSAFSRPMANQASIGPAHSWLALAVSQPVLSFTNQRLSTALTKRPGPTRTCPGVSVSSLFNVPSFPAR